YLLRIAAEPLPSSSLLATRHQEAARMRCGPRPHASPRYDMTGTSSDKNDDLLSPSCTYLFEWRRHETAELLLEWSSGLRRTVITQRPVVRSSQGSDAHKTFIINRHCRNHVTASRLSQRATRLLPRPLQIALPFNPRLDSLLSHRA